jgi:hypothetical protein
MGLTARKLQTQLDKSNLPHYYEVRTEDGERYCHCGSMVDVNNFLTANPTFTYEKIYLPHSPKTVDVPHVRMADDLQLPAQQILPQSELEPFIPDYHD